MKFVDLSAHVVSNALADRRMDEMKRVVCLYKVRRLLTRGYRLYRYRRSWIMDLIALGNDDDRVKAVLSLGMGPLAPCDDPVEASGTIYYNSAADDYIVYLRLLTTCFGDQNHISHWVMFNECFILCIFMLRLCQIAWPDRKHKIALSTLHNFIIDDANNIYDPIIWFMTQHQLPIDPRLIDITELRTYENVTDYMKSELGMMPSDELYKMVCRSFIS